MGGYRLQINDFEIAAGMLSVDNWELIRPHFYGKPHAEEIKLRCEETGKPEEIKEFL